MKTIREISVERALDRSTLLKAAQRGLFGEAAYQSGSTWLIDDTSPQFRSWLVGPNRGRPRTIPALAPEPPEWVDTESARHAWKVNHEWRCDAASANGVGAEEYRSFLLRKAERLYGNH